MVKYEVTVFMSQYMAIDDKWQIVEIKTAYEFNNWDDVNNFIGYLIEGREGKYVKFQIKMVREEVKDEQ